MRFLPVSVVSGALFFMAGCDKAPESPSAKGTSGSKLASSDTATKTVAKEQEPEVFQSLSLDQSLAKAMDQNKVVMVDFYTDWCGPCKKLDVTTWKDAEVVRWLNDKTVPVKIDAEKEKAIAKKYDIKAYPTMLFLKPDGSEIGRLIGYKNSDKFLQQAGEVVAGTSKGDNLD